MSPTAFPRFPELALELRNIIWKYTITSHIQDITSRLPPWFENLWAERRRQALVGSLPGKNRLALRVYIRDPYNGLKLRFEEDDFESLVDCLPLSAVCRETRIHVAEYCHSLVPHVQFEYDTSTLWSLEPPEDGAQPVVLRNVHCLPGAETLEHVFSRPTTLTVNAGEFKSAEHLVAMVFRFFGNRVRRLVLDLVVHEGDPIERAYWTDSVKAPLDIKPILNHGFEGDPAVAYVTRDRKLHVSESLWQDKDQDARILARHILKTYEVFDVSKERLPYLKHIDVDLESQGMSGRESSRLATVHKQDCVVGWWND